MEAQNNISQEEQELIENYLSGNLSADETAAFREKLAADEQWQQKVKEVQLYALAIQETVLKDSINRFHHEVQEPGLKALSRNNSWKKWLAAASVIGIALLIGLKFFSKPEHEKLFAAYYQLDPGLPVVMSDASADNYTLYDGMIDYKEGNNALAIKKWQDLGAAKGYTDTLNYYLGLAYLEADNDMEAKAYLEKVRSSVSGIYQQKASWFLALIYIKEKNTTKAKALLQELGDYRSAKELYSKLD